MDSTQTAQTRPMAVQRDGIPRRVDIWCIGVYCMSMDSRAVIRALESAGWELVRTRGSHHQFRHPERPDLVTVPHPKRDLPKGTLRSIERQAGLKLR